jgi:acylpyruvate hydrolase
MKLVTLSTPDGPAAHVLVDEAVSPVLRADGRAYRDLRDLFEAGDDGQRDAQLALRAVQVPFDSGHVLRPVLEPGAVICVGLNYRTHILEMGRDLPAAPTLFSKLPRALTDPGVSIRLPAYSAEIDYEGELGVVMGRGGRDLTLDEAWAAIGGFTVVNDVSVRDYQRRTPQWFAGKTGEALTPIGPAVVTPEDLEEGFGDLQLHVEVNGEPRQHALLGDLVFDVPHLVADISRIVGLRPGDIIATGTPGGVAAGMDPPRWIKDGDVVEVSIDRIGTLSNTFANVARASSPAVEVAQTEGS